MIHRGAGICLVLVACDGVGRDKICRQEFEAEGRSTSPVLGNRLIHLQARLHERLALPLLTSPILVIRSGIQKENLQKSERARERERLKQSFGATRLNTGSPIYWSRDQWHLHKTSKI